ncbi:MAG: hypothetical protein ACHQX3_10370 [Nitrospirales bacterium]
MQSYYLQFGVTDTSAREFKNGVTTVPPDPREFIDSYVHPTATLVQEVKADSWLQARSML